MYGKSTAGKDDDDNRKPSAKPLDSYRKSANTNLPEAQDAVVKDDPSSDECESTSNRKRKTESDEAEVPAKELQDEGVDLTTVAGQLALNPGMSEEDAREAAKKEYHRKHAAKSRIRHKGLLRDLTDKVAELRKSNQELRETHDQLVTQLRLYEHVEPGLASQLLPLQSDPLPTSGPRRTNDSAVDPQPDNSSRTSSLSVAPSLSELLHGGGQRLYSHQGLLQAQSQFVGLQSLLQSQTLLSPTSFPTQADTVGLIQHLLGRARDGSTVASAAATAVETDAVSRLLSEALRGQSVFNPQAQLHSSAALPMTIGNANLHLSQLAQLNDAQLALLGMNHGNPLGGRQAALLNATHPTTVQGPQDEARRNQEVIELILRYLASGRR